MYLVSLQPDSSIRDVFLAGEYVDSDVQTYPITDSEFETIRASGQHNLFKYVDGKVVTNQAQVDKLAILARIQELKKLLLNSDFKVLPDYDQPDPNVVTQRQAWRQEIRTLEAQ